MNHMKEVAHMLGLELNENFRIRLDTNRLSHFDFEYLGTVSKDWQPVCSSVLADIILGKYKIKKAVLTVKEKKTLSGIIEPYKSQVTGIKKRHFKDFSNSEKENIAIYYTEIYGEGENIVKLKGLMDLPIFPAGKYYKNMEEDKTYTLEELGL